MFRRREDEEDDESNESEEDDDEVEAAAAALELLPLPLPRGVRAPPLVLRDEEKSDEYDEKAPPESPAALASEYPLWLLAASPLPFEEENEAEADEADEAIGASPLCAAR